MTDAREAPLRATRCLWSMADGDVPCIRLESADGAHATVSLHGGQLLSWIAADGRERLFLGTRARAGAGSAIRGGVPVIFPQFAARGPLQKHGFARGMEWAFEGLDERDPATATFVLRDDDASRAQWPHGFELRLRIRLGASTLAATLDVANTGTEAFEFTCALHSYLRVDDLSQVALDGVAGASYIDSTSGGALNTEADAPLRFGPEIDRIHVDSSARKLLRDGAQSLAIDMHGFTDTVVWNPGERLAARMDDLAPGEHLQFVCVEPARIATPVRLDAGMSWRGEMTLTAQPVS